MPRGDQPGVELNHLIHDRLPGLRLCVSTRLLPHPGALSRVAGQLSHRSLQRRRIATRVAIAVYALADDISDATHPRRDHRQARRHRFDHHQPEGLQP